MRPYASTDEALADVLRLSRTMTYKNALVSLNVGGGKAVIIGDPKVDKTEVLFRAFGRYVDSLGGRYITAEDVGTDVNDMENIYLESQFVTGVHQVHGGSGDPAPFTAYGALQALMAAMRFKFGHEEVGKTSIAVQGLGHIGMELVKLLRDRGAKLYVTDLDSALVDRAVSDFGAEAVKPDEIHEVNADVFAPCALESAINADTLPRIKARIICGTANNQLSSLEIGDELHARGILYAPDYAVNSRRRDERVAGDRRLQPRTRDAPDPQHLPQPHPHLRTVAAREHRAAACGRPHRRKPHPVDRQAEDAARPQHPAPGQPARRLSLRCRAGAFDPARPPVQNPVL